MVFSLKLEVLARAERYISAVAAPIPKWARSGVSAYSFQIPLAIMSVKLKEAKLHFGLVAVIDFQTCGRDVTTDLEICRPDGHWML